MKVLILVSCVLAVASAQWGQAPVHNQHTGVYNGPQHVPQIKDGVPVETPEVQQAKANHYAAISEAVNHPAYQHNPQDNGEYNTNTYQGNQVHQQQPQRYNAPVQQFQAQPQPQYQQQQYQPQQYQPQQYQPQPQQYSAPSFQGQARQVVPAYDTTNVNPGVTREGKPLDTPEVEAAKAHHFALVNEALARATPQQPQPHYRQRRGIYAAYPQHVPVIGHNGVPVETVEVQHARAEHLAAHAAAGHGHGHHVYAIEQAHAPIYGLYDSLVHNVPTFDHEGHPIDTPEVQHAKAAHFAAYTEAAARNSPHQQVYASHNVYQQNGAPVDTPEVQHAKALHFAAHAATQHHY